MNVKKILKTNKKIVFKNKIYIKILETNQLLCGYLKIIHYTLL